MSLKRVLTRILPLALVVTALLAAAGILFQRSYATADLESRLTLGYKYITEGRYDEAIALYDEILEIDENNARALTGIGIAYSSKGEYHKAKVYLEKAVEIDPDNVESYDELSRIELIEGNEDKALKTLDQAYRDTKDSAIETLLGRITERTLAGQVVDAADDAGINNASLTMYSGENYENEVAASHTDENGTFSIKGAPGAYKLVIKADGYEDTVSYQSIGADNLTYHARVRAVRKEENKTASITVNVSDAFTGKPINGSGLTIDFIPGIYSDTPPKEESVITEKVGSNGRSTVTLPIGNYTALVTCSDNRYKPATAQVVVGGRENVEAIPLTPVIRDNEMRAVLTWSTGTDLDAFVLGRNTDGSDYKVFFKNKRHEGDTKVSLDVDVKSGYGPETMTITLSDVKEGFTFYVDHFSEGRTSTSDSSDTALSRSGAKVVLYIGNSGKKVFNVPANKKGSTWKVFEFADGDIAASNYVGTGKMIGYRDDGLID